MFFFLAILSMTAYALQESLLVRYARRMDGISLSMYRNISLWISMLPLLFLADKADFALISNFKIDLLIACVTGAIALFISFEALRFLPAGIKTVFNKIAGVTTMFLLGFFLFGETVSFFEIFFVAIIVISGILLSFQKNEFPHLDSKKASKGIALAITGAIIASFSFYFMSKVSRELSPFISGYAWEFGIGFCALLFVLIRQKITGKKLAPISWKDFGIISLVSSPTLIGTGAFAYAVTLGPIGIMNAIGVSSILVVTLLSSLLYKEKLNKWQWLIMLVIIGGLIGLKLAGV